MPRSTRNDASGRAGTAPACAAKWLRHPGSALTIANCIGFAITIGSIQLLDGLAASANPALLFLALAPGPVFGLIALAPLLRGRNGS